MSNVTRKRDGEPAIEGELQTQIMAAVWKLGEATVEDVRTEQPAGKRSAYNTVQTVMNRLVERGLLTRERQGNAYRYKPQLDETGYLTSTIRRGLSRASAQARAGALMNVVGELDADELDEIARYANRIRRKRREGDG